MSHTLIDEGTAHVVKTKKIEELSFDRGAAVDQLIGAGKCRTLEVGKSGRPIVGGPVGATWGGGEPVHLSG